MKPLGIIFLASLSWSLSGCEIRDCTEMGCENSPTRLQATLPNTIADFHGGKLTACRGSICVSSTTLTVDGDQLTISFPQPSTTATITSVSEGSRVEVSLPVIQDRFAVPEQETFRLQVTDGTGAPLFDRQVTTGTRWYPNGQDCDGNYFCTGGIVKF